MSGIKYTFSIVITMLTFCTNTILLLYSNNCILIIMSIFLEVYLEMHPDSKYLFTHDRDPKAPDRLKIEDGCLEKR